MSFEVNREVIRKKKIVDHLITLTSILVLGILYSTHICFKTFLVPINANDNANDSTLALKQ